jgi:hypothetical protein
MEEGSKLFERVFDPAMKTGKSREMCCRVGFFGSFLPTKKERKKNRWVLLLLFLPIKKIKGRGKNKIPHLAGLLLRLLCCDETHIS